MALPGGGNRASSGLYAGEDVLEREIALLEEEDPTAFLDGLVEPTVDEEQSNGFRTDNTVRPTISSSRVFSQQRLTPNTIPGLSQVKATSNHQHQHHQPSKPPHSTTENQNLTHSHNHSRVQTPRQTQSHNQNHQQPQSSSFQASSATTSHHDHSHGYQPASLSSISGAKDRSLDQLLISFWTHQMDLAERGTNTNAAGSSEAQEPHEEQDEFKTFGLPLARIKKVMKSDPEVKVSQPGNFGFFVACNSSRDVFCTDDLRRRYVLPHSTP